MVISATVLGQGIFPILTVRAVVKPLLMSLFITRCCAAIRDPRSRINTTIIISLILLDGIRQLRRGYVRLSHYSFN